MAGQLIRTLAAILVALALLPACTKTIERGTYGPFQIGQSKGAVLRILEEKGLYEIEPAPTRTLYVSSPTRETFERFPTNDGVLIWLKSHPWPLRIEFAKDVVDKTWPPFEPNEFAPKEMQEIEAELRRLRSLILPGMARPAVYDAVLAFDTVYSMTVGNFVPGYQEFREKGVPRPWPEEFKTLLLRADAWKFEGLKEILWYNPYHSKVTLYFEDDKLKRVEHWHFITELP